MSQIAELPDNVEELKSLLLQERDLLSRERGITERLKSQVHSLLEPLRLEKHRLYGTRSETSPDQARLFDEADTPEPEEVPKLPTYY